VLIYQKILQKSKQPNKIIESTFKTKIIRPNLFLK